MIEVISSADAKNACDYSFLRQSCGKCCKPFYSCYLHIFVIKKEPVSLAGQFGQ